jgi:hypothetical protein
MPIPFVQFARDCVSSFNLLKFTYATIVNVAIRFVVQKFFNAKRSKKKTFTRTTKNKIESIRNMTF